VLPQIKLVDKKQSCASNILKPVLIGLITPTNSSSPSNAKQKDIRKQRFSLPTEEEVDDEQREKEELLKLSNLKMAPSFIIWSKDKKFSKEDLDPNFLVKSQFKKSKFHQGLHKFIKQNQQCESGCNKLDAADKENSRLITYPLLHIDIHGKKDRVWNTDIDLGVKAIRE